MADDKGIAMIQITNEDNMELMARYPDKHFDLALIDPPYGIGAGTMFMGTNKTRAGKGRHPGESTADRLRRCRGGAGKLKNRAINTEVLWMRGMALEPGLFEGGIMKKMPIYCCENCSDYLCCEEDVESPDDCGGFFMEQCGNSSNGY
jgi:hypothetical protein